MNPVDQHPLRGRPARGRQRAAAVMTVCLLVLTACTDSPPVFLDGITPAHVSTLHPVAARLAGRNFFKLAKLDLSGDALRTDVGQWRVRIGDAEIPDQDVTWVDPQNIDIVIPPGLEVGIFDVVLIPPRGGQAKLAQALTVAGVDSLRVSIENAPAGSGVAMETLVLPEGQSAALFAVLRDANANYVADADAAWSIDGQGGTLSTLSGSVVTASAQAVGQLVVVAQHAPAASDTLNITVAAPCTSHADCSDPCRSTNACVEGGCFVGPLDLDADGDGAVAAACGGDDCDDDPSACGVGCHPANSGADVCDGYDHDCDGVADNGYVADAACGVGHCLATNTPSSCVAGVETTCMAGAPLDVTDASCDAVDDDCDGMVDEDGQVAWYADADGDGYGDPLVPQLACMPPPGYVANDLDCADTPLNDPACAGLDGAQCSPAVTESSAAGNCLDGADNDCDGLVDMAESTCGPTPLTLPPLAAFEVTPSVGFPSTSFGFDASASTDSEDVLAQLQVRWDWEDDGNWDTALSATKTAIHSFGVGVHRVALEVVDTSTAAAFTTRSLVVVAEPGAALVVTTPTDESDPGATPANPQGSGFSLREATAYAATQSLAQRITFNGPMTVLLTSGLLLNGVQPVHIGGSAGVTIDGSGIASSPCITLTSDNNTLTELSMVGCSGPAVLVLGHNNVFASSTVDCSSSAICVRVAGIGCRLAYLEVANSPGTAIFVEDDNVAIEHNFIHDNSVGVDIRVALVGSTVGPGNLMVNQSTAGIAASSPSTIIGNRLRANAGAVVILSGGSPSTLQANTISASTGACAVAIYGGSSSVAVVHNTMDANVGSAACVPGQGGTSNDVRNNIFSNNGQHGLESGNGQTAVRDYNAYFNNALGSCLGCVPGANAIFAAPDFVDAVVGDYRLLSGSALVDAGTDLGLDINGPAPGMYAGAAPDIGAYESP